MCLLKYGEGGSEFLTQYGGESILAIQGAHDVLLPMLDVRVDVTDDVVGRLSWGRLLALH